MSKPWFFELLEVGTYYGTTEYVQHFKCAGCGTICSNDGMMFGEPEPYCVAGYKCECGHEVTKEEVSTWKRISYDPDRAKAYRRKHGW